jgi:predicted ester cyclase
MLEANKAVIQKYVEAWDQGNMDLMEECVASDAGGRPRGGTGPARSHAHEFTRRLIGNWRTGFPDFRYTIANLTAEEDRVMAHFYFSGHDPVLFLTPIEKLHSSLPTPITGVFSGLPCE